MESSTSSVREQGVQAFRAGQIEAAIELLSRAVAADGDDAEAQAVLGLACSQKGLHARARQALETAAALAPRNARYRCQFGAALEQAGDLSGALRAYRETLQIDPSSSEAQARAGALEARSAFSPRADAEAALPPPSAAGAAAPWLVGQYAAAAGTMPCASCRQPSKPGPCCEWCGAPLASTASGGSSSAGVAAPGVSGRNRAEGLAPRSRRLADPAGRDGTRRLVGFLAVYMVVTIGLLGWLAARWLPGVLREAALPRPSPAVQSLLIRAWRAEKSAHPEEAEHLFRQALEEARVLGDQPGEAMSLSGIGYLLYEQKHPRRALEYLQPALALFQQLGDKRSTANTLNNMGLASSDLRQPQRALEYLRQALASCRDVGDKKAEAEIIDSFGMVYEADRQPQRALEYYRETLALARQIGDKADEALELKNIARLQPHLSGERPAAASAGRAPARAAPLPASRA
jgi:tetratricopeptide (TPR) repeat protein